MKNRILRPTHVIYEYSGNKNDSWRTAGKKQYLLTSKIFKVSLDGCIIEHKQV